jgi:hypothetical protein
LRRGLLNFLSELTSTLIFPISISK